MFSTMSKFFVHINTTADLKKCGEGGRYKFRQNRTTIIQINTFAKIGSVNDFKS